MKPKSLEGNPVEKSSVLMVSPIDVSSRILGPLRHEKEFAEIVSDSTTTYLIVGIAITRFLSRSKFVHDIFGPVSRKLKVIVLPLSKVRYGLVLTTIVFSLVSAFILVLCHKALRVKMVISREVSVPVFMSLATSLLGLPMVYRAINTPFWAEMTANYDFPGPVRRVHRALTGIFDLVALRTASLILTPSIDGEELIRSRLSVGRNRILCVRFPIPDFFYDQMKRKVDTASNDSQKVRLVYCGSFYEFYNFKALFAAIRQLSGVGCDITLNMYGDGPVRGRVLKQAVELGVQHKVIVHEPVSREQVPEVYRSATAAVIPFSGNFERGVSMKSVEAMVVGVPCIVSKQSDPLYVDGQNCIVVGSDNAEAWSIAIRKLMNPDVRRKVVLGGMEAAKPYRQSVIAEIVRSIIP
jgi:glycosyltransferase involved in cell wall biosynthesis